MTSFTSLSQYAPLLVGLLGLTWFLALWSLGRAICLCTGLRLPSPWSDVVASLLGIQTVCLVIQVAGTVGFGLRTALPAIWALLSVAGGVAAFISLRQWRPVWTPSSPVLLVPLAIILLAVAANLLVAMAPSTKIDEIYYHMLVPSRIVWDGALIFYREPWVAAVWPQMTYQVSATPLHAIGYPDAQNVVSWALSVLLLRFAWAVVRDRGGSPFLGAVMIAALSVGLYPVVWHVNGGAHAMGDLAMAAAIVAFVGRDRLTARLGPERYAGMLSILLLSGATSKISLLPICMVVLCTSAWQLLKPLPRRNRLSVVGAGALPWLIYYVPVLVWTWAQSGSPFGPMLAGEFGRSLYSPEQMHETLLYARDNFQPSLWSFVKLTAVSYSPLVWVGIVGALLGTDLSRFTRVALAAIFLLQCSVVYFLLPHDVRFLGGIQFGLLIVFAAYARECVARMAVPARATILASALFLLPWLGAQLYYAKQFFPVALGLEKDAFYRRYVAFFDDYTALDRMLPKDAVFLAQPGQGHPSPVYAPRLMVFDPHDLPRNAQPVLFTYPPNGKRDLSFSSPYKLGEIVYSNARALTVTYRTIGRPPKVAPLEVRRLLRN